MGRIFPFPENISTFGQDIDFLFNVIVIITGLTFVLVEVALVVFMIKYRGRPGAPKAFYTHGNKRLEVIWTTATAVIVLILGAWSWPLWLNIKDPNRFPPAQLELGIMVKQFEWNVTYPGADGRLGTPDDFTKRNQLHIPVNAKVRATLESEDVIHSFYLPNFRLKQDAVPGMKIPIWFEAAKTGNYEIACAELCGLGHYRMKGAVTVHSAEEFNTWSAQQAATAAAGGN
ncbi:MAG TPA: cytochrome c oxidase subunit II [Longimicrobiales bacterium]|nr:cytochrome c oxidase subunit II [Longimicrobiales bacterium]